MSREYPKLKNAPITEVVIGISSDNLFQSFENIRDFYNSSNYLKDNFIEAQELKTFKLELSEEEAKFSKTMSIGKRFESKNNMEYINIECNKLMFSDKSPYTDFDTFAKKFYNIFNEILKFKNNNISISDIGLRYVNVFIFSNEKIKAEFKVNSSISTQLSHEKFAEQINSLFITQIRSIENKDIYAVIRTINEQENEVSSKIVFDIDTHIVDVDIDSVDTFEEKILKLKDFKNDIFFSNFNDAHKIEEFR